MGFKTRTGMITKVISAIAQIPRRLSGRPIMSSKAYDLEICGPLYETYITTAFDYVADRATLIKALGDECQKLGTRLEDKSVDNVYITCANCAGPPDSPSSSRSSDQSLQLCLWTYGIGLTQPITNGLVFRELIRLCGGTDLDAWGLYFYFTGIHSTSLGTTYDPVPIAIKRLMCAGSTPLGATGTAAGPWRRGVFTIWDTSWGAYYPLKISPGAGISQTGFGYSGLSLTRTGIGTSRPEWQHMCP